MRPISYRDVRAGLRLIFIATVQMNRSFVQQMSEIKRQISPICRTRSRMKLFLTGELLDRCCIAEPGGKTLAAEYPQSHSMRMPGKCSCLAVETRLSRHPGSTEFYKIRTCCYANKFILYKTHLVLDINYLILANVARTSVFQRVTKSGRFSM